VNNLLNVKHVKKVVPAGFEPAPTNPETDTLTTQPPCLINRDNDGDNGEVNYFNLLVNLLSSCQ